MRQGNGTDLLGANDPRAASIGVIYVAPNDDRTSVLAAILTQEKLGRKQVAVVLPNPNKAFQRPVDFDDLKALRRKVQITVVFIASPGPGPAEFARQRRFPVYSSLESYAESLHEQDGNLVESGAGAEKKGFWPFGRAKNNNAGASSAAAVLPEPDLPFPPQDDENYQDEEPYDEEFEPEEELTAAPVSPRRHAQVDDAFMVDDEDDRGAGPVLGAAGAAAAGAGAGFVLGSLTSSRWSPVPNAPSEANATQAMNLDDDEDALPPPPSAQPPATSSRNFGAGAGAGGVSSIPVRSGTSAPGPAPVTPPTANAGGLLEEDDQTGADAGIAAGAGTAAGAAVAGGPGIIDLTQRKGPRNTAQLPNTPPDQQPVPARSSRRSGNIAGAAAAGLAAGVLGAGAVDSSRANAGAARGVAAGSPARGVPSGGRGNGGSGGSGGNGGPGRPARSGRFRWALLALLLLAVALLVCGSLAYAGSPILGGVTSRINLPGTTPPATVTITPSSTIVSNSYVITGVSGTPDPKQQTIKARTLDSSAQSEQLSAKASGHAQTVGKAATGTLTFFNLNSADTTIKAHTVLTTANGVQLWNDTAVTIPPSNLPVAGEQTVSATVLSIGTAGNISAGTINAPCCTGGVSVKNTTAFSGGQDPANYNFVTQDDVNAVATQQVQNQIAQQAANQLKGKLVNGELLAQSPQCQTNVSSSAPVGDHHHDVESTGVTVNATCNSVAYDDQGMRSLVTQLLTQKAQVSPGPGYVLQDNRVIITPKIQSTNPVSLTVNARGQWIYQFTDALKQDLVQKILGKSVDVAKTALLSAHGVSGATIQFNGTTLPTDPKVFTIVIENPTPLSGSTGGVSASPTVTSGEAGPGTPSGIGRG